MTSYYGLVARSASLLSFVNKGLRILIVTPLASLGMAKYYPLKCHFRERLSASTYST